MKILVIAPRFPFPIEKGDKLRLYHQIKILARYYKIILLSLSDTPVNADDIAHVEKFVDKVHVFRLNRLGIIFNNLNNLFSTLPFQVLYFYNRKIAISIKNIVAREKPDVIYNQLIRTTEYSRNLDAFKVLDYMDAFSEGMHKRLSNSSFPFKLFYRLERDRLKRYEREVYGDFDAHSIISQQDKTRINRGVFDDIKVVPNGVDTSFFLKFSTEKKYDLCFVGNMGYRPNIIAAEYLCQKIIPELIKVKKNIRVLLAGARPHRRVKALANDHVFVSGWMEDIRLAYNQSRIFVAPIFTGIGQQNKVLEAMSMEMPCVCTTMVNNPIGTIDGEQVLIADDSKAFVEQIITLLDDESKAGAMGMKCREFVMENYSWEQQVNKLIEIIEKK